ncbi:MAG: peptidoglycan recognition family protein [Phormidesmis sp.]
MRRSWFVWAASVIAFFITVIVVVTSGPAQKSAAQSENAPKIAAARLPQVQAYAQSNPSSQSNLSPSGSSGASTDFTISDPASDVGGEIGDDVGRQINSVPATSVAQAAQAAQAGSYQPREIVQLADSSNYGERFTRDAMGSPVSNDYIVVLHETVGSAMSALNLFQVNHPRDEDQVSYHTLIATDGTIVYVVPPEQRAFGAGDSVFQSTKGEESVVTNPGFPSSVNNFAYHISLETPPDGRNNNAATHSGYTEAQYQSLAWLLARTNIPNERITTHQLVDRSGSRMDPRSFDANRMYELLSQYPSRQVLR